MTRGESGARQRYSPPGPRCARVPSSLIALRRQRAHQAIPSAQRCQAYGSYTALQGHLHTGVARANHFSFLPRPRFTRALLGLTNDPRLVVFSHWNHCVFPSFSSITHICVLYAWLSSGRSCMTRPLDRAAESNTPGIPAPGCVPAPTRYSPSSVLERLWGRK